MPPPTLISYLQLSWQVMTKDLRIEVRSKVALNHIVPFAICVLVLFGFALDADTESLGSFTPGLFWVTVLLVALLAIGRSFAVERSDGALDSFRLSATPPAAIFFGKAAAIWVQLLLLQVVLGVGVLVFYSANLAKPGLLLASCALGSAGIACAGTLYGVVTSQYSYRDTLLPLLLLPALAPVLIGGTRALGDAFGTVGVNGWSWLGLLGAVALVYAVLGAVSFGTLLEDD